MHVNMKALLYLMQVLAGMHACIMLFNTHVGIQLLVYKSMLS